MIDGDAADTSRPLELQCKACNGAGWFEDGVFICRECDGAGYIPTEDGRRILDLMSQFPPTV
jgi:DnaJ-class molecular chaperone